MRDAVAVEDARSFKELKDDPLYVGRTRIHPKDVSGPFRRFKWVALIVLLGLYYVVPWIRWDRGPGLPDQAVLVDMGSRRLYFFWLEIWPQEIYYLTLALIIGAFGLFFVSSLLGRVWCAYSCPQTVWTDLFMWVERQIEGDRGARMRLDKAPPSVTKLRLRLTKHALWLLIAAATGGAWIMYFNDAPTVVGDILTGQAGAGVYFFFGLFTATTYVLAGMAREQVCTYMCPWPRFQAALLDHDSYVVTYQKWRGEPRGPHRRDETWEGRGDCIACNNCVAVCPTGIDIRDGLQLECIGCGLCIDACNDVMSRIGRPTDLITLSTERNQRRYAAGLSAQHRPIRKRTIMYAVILSVIATGVVGSLFLRSTVDINVLHDRNPLFVTLSDGTIRNGFSIKILNKSRDAQSYDLSIDGLTQAELRYAGRQDVAGGIVPLDAKPDGVTTHRVFVEVPKEAVASPSASFEMVLTNRASGESARHGTVFRGPGT